MTATDPKTPLTRPALERLIRDTVPAPPAGTPARDDYDAQLRDWLAAPEWQRDVIGFERAWLGYDESLLF